MSCADTLVVYDDLVALSSQVFEKNWAILKMSRSDEERARQEKLLTVTKRFWTFFVLGVICIFVGVVLVAIANNIGHRGIKLAGFICGCYGIFLDLASLLYMSIQKRRDFLPVCCFNWDSESSSQETNSRDIEREGSLRPGNFERPPSYRTCLKMKNPDSPPSYSEVILSISKTNVNSQVADNNDEPVNEDGQTSENVQAINEHTHSTNENMQLTNENTQSTVESPVATNESAESTNENTQSTNENTQALNECGDNAQTLVDNEQPVHP